jgi:hypothetical protein
MSLPTLPSGGQTVYNFLMNTSSAGQLYDIGFIDVISPVNPYNYIPTGLGVSKVIGADYQVQLPFQNIVTVTQSANLSASNSTVVTLNGIALTPVVYATSNAATMGAIATLIASQPGILSAVTAVSNTEIVITASPGFAVTATFVTTGGSAVTWASVYSNNVDFYGVSIYIQNQQNLLGVGGNGSAGPSPYVPGMPVSTLRRGRIWVTTETTVTSDSPVYWRIIPTVSNPQVGGFRGDSDTGNAILISSSNAAWLQGNSAGGLAVLDINLV